jgi:hypothetical protein
MPDSPETGRFREESPTSWRSVAQRGLQMLWSVHFMATLAAGSSAIGIVLYDLAIQWTHPQNFNNMLDTAAWLFFAAALNLPLSLAIRRYGVANLRFLSHESYFLTRDGTIDEAFLSPAAHHLIRLLDLLENASVLDRQPARRQLKDWLDRHHEALTLTELEYVREQFAYLFDPLWKERRVPA